jgi:hypothetical protein
LRDLVVCSIDRVEPAEVIVSGEDTPNKDTDRVVFVCAGGRHTCAMVSHSGRLAVHTTGANNYGQLGLNDTSPRDRCGSRMDLL